MVLRRKLAILTLVVLFAVCLSNVESLPCRIIYIRRCYLYRNSYGQLWLRCYFILIRRSYGKRTIEHDKDVAPFPVQFDVYDINKDGQITLEELAKATNTKEHSEVTEKAFKEANKNVGDGIDCDEFKAAPFLFNHRTTCGQDMRLGLLNLL